MVRPAGAFAGFAFALGIMVGMSFAAPGIGLMADEEPVGVVDEVVDPCDSDEGQSSDAVTDQTDTTTDQTDVVGDCDPTEDQTDTADQTDTGEVEGGGQDNHGAAVRVAAHCDLPGHDHGEFVRSIAHDHEISPEQVERQCQALLDELQTETVTEAATKSHGPK